MGVSGEASGRRPRLLLAVGSAVLVLLMTLHFGDVLGMTRGTGLFAVGEFVRANVTPLAWCAYIVMLMGMLGYVDGRSFVGRYRRRLLVCWLWSTPAWCYFDWMNFYFMRDATTGLRAWEYVNLPPDFGDRLLGYVLAFGAIAPGMFLTAEVLQRAGLWRMSFAQRRMERTGRRRPTKLLVATFVLGLVLAPVPMVVGGPASNLAIWVGTWALLDPINYFFGRPSIGGDWEAGRWGRTLSLGAGGLLCGFLWEFWNFWSYTKWVYHLPFLGAWQRYRYFEMPVPGLIGFIAFGIETWTMWQTSLLILSAFVEGERGAAGDVGMRDFGCF